MKHDRWNDLRAFLDFVDAILATVGEDVTLSEALELWDYDSPENAQKLLSLKPAPGVQARVEELAARANEGELTAEERAEYSTYVEADDVLNLHKLRARRRGSLADTDV